MAIMDTAKIHGYHAHIYYDADSKSAAADLRAAIEEKFDMVMGRWHDRPVGPHPCWSYQVAFSPEVFPQIVPWLALNHGELVVFIHPETGETLEDHRDRAIWLGQTQKLNLNIFDKSPS